MYVYKLYRIKLDTHKYYNHEMLIKKKKQQQHVATSAELKSMSSPDYGNLITAASTLIRPTSFLHVVIMTVRYVRIILLVHVIIFFIVATATHRHVNYVTSFRLSK